MALYIFLRKSCVSYPFPAMATNLIEKIEQTKLYYARRKSRNYYLTENEDESELDNFTSRLMQQKSTKWENRKSALQKDLKDKKLVSNSKQSTTVGFQNDIQFLNIDEINLLFQKAIDFEENHTVVELIKQCIQHDKCPALSVLLHALSVCSQNGDRQTIIEIAELCGKVRPEVLQENSHFEHYLAEAIWIKGNVTKSLEIFEKVYKENVYLRRRIRCILKHLILDVVTSRSEAILINIIHFSEKLLHQHGDYFPLVCVWQACFLSEWFTDQQLALDLLEKNPDLCNKVVNKIPHVVTVSLKKHKTEVVYRLTEMLLKFNMTVHLVEVLLALLDYWLKRGDLRQCNEIITWSVKNNIELPAVSYSKKLLGVLKEQNVSTKSGLNVPRRPPSDYQF